MRSPVHPRLRRSLARVLTSLTLLSGLLAVLPLPASAAPADPPVDAAAALLDVTGDGLVTNADVMQAVSAWITLRESGGGGPCGPLPSPKLDVTGDGCLDIQDVQRIASFVGVATKQQAVPRGRRLSQLLSDTGTQTTAALTSDAAPTRLLAVEGSTLTVNATADGDDASPGDGLCATATAGQCTLRAAITEANALVGPNTIAFAIPGSGVQTIIISSMLPIINDESGPLTIDGYTQPGASPNTDPLKSNAVLKVQLSGAISEPNIFCTVSSCNLVHGLEVTSANNVIRGLATLKLRRSIWLDGTGAHDNVITGNFIGGGTAGTIWTTKSQNVAYGIVLWNAQNNTVGGTTAAERNVIAGNAQDGMWIPAENATGNLVRNNLIGLKADGTQLSNVGDGIDVNSGAHGNRIEQNVLSGNNNDGIEISHNGAGVNQDNVVINNLIGTDVFGTGTNGTRNLQYGVSLEDGPSHTMVTNNTIANNRDGNVHIYGVGGDYNTIQNNRIGVLSNGVVVTGVTPYGVNIRLGASHNLIANNVIAGHQIGINLVSADTQYNTFTHNAIYANTSLGIDIEPAGVNVNGANTEAGANFRRKYPEVTGATATQVSGTVCGSCTVEVFKADRGVGNYGQGQTFVGAGVASGAGAFAVAVTGLAVGDVITTTATDPSGNTSEFSPNKVTTSSGGINPPTVTLPGRIQAENYKVGGEGVGYHDTTPADNKGGAYRTDGVDIEDTADTGGGFDVGWTAPGEWLAYAIHVNTAGSYNLVARVASTTSGKTMHVELGGVNLSGPINVPNTGGWQNWATATSGSFTLPAGDATLRLVFDTGNYNVNFFDINAATSNPWDTQFSLPGTIQAENYKSGGEGTGYHDTTAGNSGGQYRSDRVDIETTTDTGGGYNVGYIAAGEWLAYDVNVTTTGIRTIALRVASTSSGKKVHVELDGINITGSLTVPNTGGWQNWTTITSNPVLLNAGAHGLRIVAETDGFNLNYVTVQ